MQEFAAVSIPKFGGFVFAASEEVFACGIGADSTDFRGVHFGVEGQDGGLGLGLGFVWEEGNGEEEEEG